MRRHFSLVLVLGIFLLCSSSAFGQELREQQPSSQFSQESTDREAVLRTAASQYEIIDVLLAEGRYREVVPEFSEIIALGFIGQDEILLAQATWEIAGQLREQSQFEIAHQVVDQALEAVTNREARYSLLMMRGKIYKDQHRYGEAISALREAQKLGISIPEEEGPPGR